MGTFLKHAGISVAIAALVALGAMLSSIPSGVKYGAIFSAVGAALKGLIEEAILYLKSKDVQ